MFKELVKGVRIVASRYVRDVKSVREKLDPYKELMLFDFTKEDTLKQWDCISDADIDGHSWAVLEQNKRGKGEIKLCCKQRMLYFRWGCV